MQLKGATNRAWDITGAADGSLRIGNRWLPLAEIRGVRIAANSERDFLGSLLNYSAYLIVAAMFMIFVLQAGWRERFLLATVFFFIVGSSSLIDIWQSRRIKLYKLTIERTDGSVVDFTSADPREVDRLAAALRQAGKA
jgi:hypothetical protein